MYDGYTGTYVGDTTGIYTGTGTYIGTHLGTYIGTGSHLGTRNFGVHVGNDGVQLGTSRVL